MAEYKNGSKLDVAFSIIVELIDGALGNTKLPFLISIYILYSKDF